MIVKCLTKNEVKRSSQLGEIYVKESNNLASRENFGAKTHEPDCYITVLEMTKSIYSFY